MAYSIEVDDVVDQIDALPKAARVALAEAFALLELDPWSAPPHNAENPDGAVRTLAFGEHGLVTFLVLDEQQRVDLLAVLWAEP